MQSRVFWPLSQLCLRACPRTGVCSYSPAAIADTMYLFCLISHMQAAGVTDRGEAKWTNVHSLTSGHWKLLFNATSIHWCKQDVFPKPRPRPSIQYNNVTHAKCIVQKQSKITFFHFVYTHYIISYPFLQRHSLICHLCQCYMLHRL